MVQMKYSKDEIQSQYRDAKKKREQIGILADMNCCSKKEMREYLRDVCGFEVYEPVAPSAEELAARREKMLATRKANKAKKEAERYTEFTSDDLAAMQSEVPDLPPVEDDLPWVDVPQDNVRLYADNDGGVCSPDAEVDRDTGKAIEPKKAIKPIITVRDVKAEAFGAISEMFGKVPTDWVEGFMQGIEMVIRMMEA